MALSLPSHFRGLLGPMIDEFQKNEDMQHELKGKMAELRSKSLETQAHAAQQLMGDLKLTAHTLECSLGMLVQKQAGEKQLQKQLEAKDQAIERMQAQIGRVDEAYLRALGTPTFTAAPQATSAEFEEIAAEMIEYSRALQEKRRQQRK